MSESEALLYDHAQDLEVEIARPLPDWGGDDVFAVAPRRRFARTAPAEPSPQPAPARRTVIVTGRPFDHPRRRPPARSVDERLMSSPDRIAAWAFGLGLILVLTALATAPS